MNRYVEAAVDSEIQALRHTSSGRACAAFKAAAAIGGFVGAGEVDRSVAERALLSAALETGLPEREAAGHIRRGILRGEKTPRTVPETVCHRNIKFRAPRFARPAVPARTHADPSPARPPHQEVAALWAASLPVSAAPEATAWFAHRFGRAAAWSIQQADLWDLARVIPAGLRLPRWARSAGRPVDPHRPPHHLPPLGPHGPGRLAPRPLDRQPPWPRNPWPPPATPSRAWSSPTRSPSNSSAASAPPGGNRARSSSPKASPTGSSGPCASARPTSRAPPSSASSRAPGPRRSPPASPRTPRWSSAPTTTSPASATPSRSRPPSTDAAASSAAARERRSRSLR